MDFSWLNFTSSFFSALCGAFFGALSAFSFRKKEGKEKEEERRKGSLNKALFVLVRQANNMEIIQRQNAPFRDNPDRAFNLPATKPVGMERVVQDEESLYFYGG